MVEDVLVSTDGLTPFHPVHPYCPQPSSFSQQANTQIFSMWIPGHLNFVVTDAVEVAAKHATFFPEITDPLSSRDLKLQELLPFRVISKEL